MPRKPPCLNTRPRGASSTDASRPSAAKRGYGSKWQRTRAAKLAQDPMCEDCAAAGLTTAANEVDHIDGMGPNGERGHDLDNLRSLCKPCHARKTVLCDGGFGHHKRQS